MQQKTRSNDECLLRYGVGQTIFCHFRSFFILLPHYWPWKLKWFLRYKVQRTKFFVNLGHFLLSDHPNDPKNQNFEKTKITPGDIIILHLCTTNDDNMMYGSWYIKRDRYSFLSLWAILCSFTTLTTQKIRFWKKEKNSWKDYHSTHEFHKWKSYDAWFLRYGVWQTGFFVILDHFLPFYPYRSVP